MRYSAIFSILPLLLLIPALPAAHAAQPVPGESSAAAILAYHRVGEDAYPDNSIRTEQFLAHVEEIEKGDYTVLPLSAIVAAAANGATLPENAIAITFEGGFRSAFENAMPVLLAKKIPFTVFYASDYADAQSGQHMSWQDLKTLSRTPGVEIGLHPSSFSHILREPEEETRRLINRAVLRHREMLDMPPGYFAYPFGEYSRALQETVRQAGFTSAFGLQSGAASPHSDVYAIPRFSMTERYGTLERFKLVAHALPLLAFDIEPQDPLLRNETPAIGFSVPAALEKDLPSLACHVSGQPAPEIQTIGPRVELRLTEPITDGRVRINCTMPAERNMADEENTKWRWLGMILTNPRAEYKEQEETGEEVTLP